MGCYYSDALFVPGAWHLSQSLSMPSMMKPHQTSAGWRQWPTTISSGGLLGTHTVGSVTCTLAAKKAIGEFLEMSQGCCSKTWVQVLRLSC